MTNDELRSELEAKVKAAQDRTDHWTAEHDTTMTVESRTQAMYWLGVERGIRAALELIS